MAIDIQRAPNGTILPGQVLNPNGRPVSPRLPKARQFLADKNWNPIEKLLEIYRDLGETTGENADLKVKIALEVHKYVEGVRRETTDPDQATTPEESVERAKVAQSLLARLNQEIPVPK
jgi:hypothetical protein